MPVTRPRSGSTPSSGLRYDALLAVIPAVLVMGAVVGYATSVPLREGIAAGELLAALLVGYALFGDPPTSGGDRGRVSG